MSAQTIGQLLDVSSAENPERVAFTLLADGETQEVPLTVGELDGRARQIASRLQQLGLQGERVILAFPFCLEFYEAFMGCIYAGAIAVLAYPPRPDRPLTPLQNTVIDSGAKAILTMMGYGLLLSTQVASYPGLQSLLWLSIEEIFAKEDPNQWVDPMLTGKAPALLSYTSGSTNMPKGVLLSHENLITSMEALIETFNPKPGMTGLFCNPLFHVIGVVLPVVASLMNNARVFLLPTQLLLAKPSLWLEAVSRYRAEVTGSFAFLFRMAMQITPAERDQLDLSCIQHLFIGGERIDAALLERFSEYFEPTGFRQQALRPMYGLTELSSIATIADGFRHTAFQREYLRKNWSAPVTEKQQDGEDLVSCGKPLLGKIVVIDPKDLTPCDNNEIGEIWAQGPHIGLKYWNKPDETMLRFQSFLPDPGEGPFLRTGDLGFLYEDELYITGRIKDIIILRGQNYQATDFEATIASAHPAIVPGGSAAVGIHVLGEEQLAVVQEVPPETAEKDLNQVATSIRERISRAFEQPVYAVVLVEKGKLPRTATGKIQRYRCLDAYQNGEVTPLKISVLSQQTAIAADARPQQEMLPRTAVESALRGIWIGILKQTDFGIHDNFFALGGNSLQAAQVMSHIYDVFQVDLQLQAFFYEPTIAGLAKNIEQARILSRG